MHIKRVTIHGFKSYRERTVCGDLSPGHNSIVGFNGSGKSNFFAGAQTEDKLFALHILTFLLCIRPCGLPVASFTTYLRVVVQKRYHAQYFEHCRSEGVFTSFQVLFSC